MTRADLEEVVLEVFEEYMPKAVTKPVRKEIARELVGELEDRGYIEIEESFDEEDSDEVDDLPF